MTVGETPVKRGRRGPYAKSKQTRRSILDSALQVFAESGYRSGSLRDVAEQVGMSEAGLLHHFTNKSALLSAVLEHRDDVTRERFDLTAERDARGRPKPPERSMSTKPCSALRTVRVASTASSPPMP